MGVNPRSNRRRQYGGELPIARDGRSVKTLGQIKSLLPEFYPNMIPITSGRLLDNQMLSKLNEITGLARNLTYGQKMVNRDPAARKLFNYNMGKFLSKSPNITNEDLQALSHLFPKYETRRRLQTGELNKDDLIEQVLRATRQKDFSTRPEGLGDFSFSALRPYDHQSLVNRLYPRQTRIVTQDPYSMPVSPVEGGHLGEDFYQPWADPNNFTDQGARYWGMNTNVKSAVPVLYARDYNSPRELQSFAKDRMNQMMLDSPIGSTIIPAASLTPDSYLMGLTQMLRGFNKYKDSGFIAPELLFLGYQPLTTSSFLDTSLFSSGSRYKQEMPEGFTIESGPGGFNMSTDYNQWMYKNQLRKEYIQKKLQDIYRKNKVDGLPGLQYDPDRAITEESLLLYPEKNRGLGKENVISMPDVQGFADRQNRLMFFPQYGIVKKAQPTRSEALDFQWKKGGEYKLGDKVKKSEVDRLRKLGYTVRKIK